MNTNGNITIGGVWYCGIFITANFAFVSPEMLNDFLIKRDELVFFFILAKD